MTLLSLYFSFLFVNFALGTLHSPWREVLHAFITIFECCYFCLLAEYQSSVALSTQNTVLIELVCSRTPAQTHRPICNKVIIIARFPCLFHHFILTSPRTAWRDMVEMQWSRRLSSPWEPLPHCNNKWKNSAVLTPAVLLHSLSTHKFGAPWDRVKRSSLPLPEQASSSHPKPFYHQYHPQGTVRQRTDYTHSHFLWNKDPPPPLQRRTSFFNNNQLQHPVMEITSTTIAELGYEIVITIQFGEEKSSKYVWLTLLHKQCDSQIKFTTYTKKTSKNRSS